jgi:hypothetical protein
MCPTASWSCTRRDRRRIQAKETTVEELVFYMAGARRAGRRRSSHETILAETSPETRLYQCAGLIGLNRHRLIAGLIS